MNETLRIVLVLLGADGLAILGGLGVLAVTSLLGWWTLKLIGRAYRSKRLNDRSLLLYSLWAVVVLSHATVLSTQEGGPGEDWAWIVFPVVAIGAYWLVDQAASKLLCHSVTRHDTAPVLFLRVFSLGKRSERLFYVLASRWLQICSVVFVSGPDLATGTVQPHQFLEFLARRLRRQFVKDEADLARRLSELDLQPDSSGRYRVNQLFCLADTWQAAVHRLVGQAGAVVMDLRGFSSANRGCLYEIQQLLAHVPLRRLLFIVDRTTDWAFLETTVHELWVTLTIDDKPAAGPSHLRLFQLERVTSREVRKIFELVIDSRSARVSREQDPAGGAGSDRRARA